MNLENALEVLGLTFNFSKTDLKNAYRKKVNEWHPDKYGHASSEMQKLAEEKMKEVNIAHDYLLLFIEKNVVANSSVQDYTQRINLGKYHREKCKNLYSYLNLEICDGIILVLEKKIRSIIRMFEFKYFTTKDEVDEGYISTQDRIIVEYYYFFKRYCKENYIEDELVISDVSFSYYLKEFYEVLVRVRNKHSKIVLFERRLQNETEKYQRYAEYDKLKDLINSIILRASNRARNYKYRQLDKIMEAMHKEIIRCFENHFSILERLNSVKSFFQIRYPNVSYELLNKLCGICSLDRVSQMIRIPQKELKMLREVLNYKIDYCKETFEETESRLKKWEEFIEDLKQIDEMEKDLIVKELLKKITDRAIEVISVLEMCGYYDAQVVNTVDCVGKLIEMYKRGAISAKNILLLEGITFIDLQKDTAIIVKILELMEGYGEPSEGDLSKGRNLTMRWDG